MAVLELALLGPFTAAYNNQPLNNFRATKAQALLIYLAVEKTRPHRREQLFTMLWPGMPEGSARHNLRQVLYALRQLIPDISSSIDREPIPLMLTDRQTVQLNPDADIKVDIHQFESLINQSKKHSHPSLTGCDLCVQALEQAVALYRGDYLSDFYLDDSNAFEDWAGAVREKCAGELLDALHTLTEICINKQDYENAQMYINRQIDIDNLRESSHRQLMEVLVLSGHRLEALRHYLEYSQLLESELGVTPSQETTDFYEQILKERFPKGSKQFAPKLEEVPITPHNLPQQLTPFFGREAELEDLDRFIADPGIRLITIVGPGGFGKTRLALACADRQLTQMAHVFPHGIYFISLDKLVDNSLLIPTVANAINLQIEGDLPEGHSPRQQLLDFLQHRQILLLMDNFEHLLDGSELLVEILRSAPNVQIIVTSRERLNLFTEQVYTIGGLPYADWGTIEEASRSPSAQLFLQSARRVQPGYELSEGDDFESLVHICQDLGGIPLALELSAVWVDMLSLGEIYIEIQQSLDFLETELIDVPLRHRGMRVVFDTTWEQLGSAERDFLSWFSVFRGGCTREAAQAVTGAKLRILAKLRNKSLIQYDQTSQRYQIHGLLRQFAFEKLAVNTNDETAARQAHCAYYCKKLNQWERELKSVRQQAIVSEIEADYINIQTAWNWAVEKLDLELLALAVSCLGEYYEVSHRQVEAEMLFSKATKRLQSTFGSQPEDAMPALLLAHLLAHQVFKRRGSWGTSSDYGDANAKKVLLQSLSLLKSTSIEKKDTSHIEAYIHLQLGRVPAIDNRREHLEESFRIYEMLGDEVGMADALYQVAANDETSLDSRGYLIRSLDLLRKRGDPERISRSLMELGYIARIEQKYEEAIKIFEDAYKASRARDHPVGMAKARRQSAYLSWFLGDFDIALSHQVEGLALCRQASNRILEAVFLNHIGLTEAYRGQFLKGIALIQESEAVSSQLNRIYLTFAHIHAGQIITAGQLLDSSSSDWGLRLRAWIALVEEDFKKALDFAQQSINICKKWGDIEIERISWTQAALARALYGLGQFDEAKHELFQGMSTCVEIRAFLPLMHLIPVIAYVMVYQKEEELKERAVELYAMAESLPFVGNSKLFEAITGRYVTEASAHLPIEVIKAAKARGQAFDWWERSEMLLDELRVLGWDSFDG